MKARMTTGLFQFEQCRLSVEDNKLHVDFQGDRKPLILSGVKGVAVSKHPDGTQDVLLTTEKEQFHFMLEGVEDKEVAALFIGLSKKSTQLELRMN